MAQDKIDLGMSAQDVVAGFEAITRAFSLAGDEYKKLVDIFTRNQINLQAAVKLGSEGGLLQQPEVKKVTINQQINDIMKVVETHRLVGKEGEKSLSITKEAIIDTTRAYRELQRQIEKTAEAERRRSAIASVRKIVGKPDDLDATLKERANYATAISNLANYTAEHANKVGDVARIWKDIGDNKISKYTGELARIQQLILAAKDAENRLGEEHRLATLEAQKEAAAQQEIVYRARLAAQIVAGIRAGTVLGGKSTATTLNYQAELANLSSLLKQHTVTKATIQKMWSDLAKGEINDYDKDLNKIRDSLIRIQRAQGVMGQEGTAVANKQATEFKNAADGVLGIVEAQKQLEKQNKKVLISWQSIVRIATIQVLHQGVTALTRAMREGVDTAAEFSKRIGEIRTISQSADINTTTWAKGLRKLSDSFGIDILDQTEAAYQALSNQVVQSSETFLFLAEASKFSRAAVATSADSVNLLTAALNSFQKDVTQSTDIAASLFKTIELGRVRADEMADSFGRVAVPASQLGVDLNELNAAIAVATIRGIKFSEASTLIRNVILKLINPTDEMKKLFAEWGVVSGTAAVSAFGFSGVLALIEKAAKGDATELSELFGRIRATTGAMLFAGDGLIRYKTSLDEITNSRESFNNAIKEMLNNPGVIIEKEKEKIKNFFRVDLGQSLLDVIAKLTFGLDNIANAVKLLVTIIIDLGKAVIATFAVKLFVGLVKVTYQLGLMVKAMFAVNAAQSSLKKAIVANPYLALGTAIFALVSIYTLAGNSIEKFNEKVRVSVETAVNNTNEIYEKARETRVKDEENYLNRLQVTNREYLQASADRIKAINKEKDAINKTYAKNIEAVEDYKKEFDKAVKDSTDIIKDQNTEVGQSINKLQTDIAQQIKRIQDIKEEESDVAFDITLQLADSKQLEADYDKTLDYLMKRRDRFVEQNRYKDALRLQVDIKQLTRRKAYENLESIRKQVELIDNRIEELKVNAQSFALAGDTDNLKEIETEITRLAQQRFTLLEKTVKDEIGRQDFITGQIEYQNSLYDARIALNETAAKAQKDALTEQMALQKQLTEEELRRSLITIEMGVLYKKIADFKSKEYDQAKTTDEVNRIYEERTGFITRILDLESQLGIDTGLRTRLLATANEEYAQTINASKRIIELEKSSKLTETTSAVENNINTIRQTINSLTDQTRQFDVSIESLLATIREFTKEGPPDWYADFENMQRLIEGSAIGAAFTGITAFGKPKGGPRVQPFGAVDFESTKETLATIDDIASLVKTISLDDNFKIDESTTNLLRYYQKILANIVDQRSDLIKLAIDEGKGIDYASMELGINKDIAQEAVDIYKNIRQLQIDIVGLIGSENDAQRSRVLQIRSMRDAIGDYSKLMQTIGRDIDGSVVQEFSKSNMELNELIEGTKTLSELFKKLAEYQAAIKNNTFISTVKPFTYNTPEKPNTSSMTITVGDINIAVKEVADLSAEELGKIIQRGIRQGRLKLNEYSGLW